MFYKNIVTYMYLNFWCLQLESIQLENEQLKDKLEEVTLDLEILKNEVSEGGATYAHGIFIYQT